MATLTSSESKAGLRVDSEWLVASENLKIDEMIGQGSFGTVHRGEYQLCTVAIKKIHSGANKAQKEAASKALDREVRALTRVRHENIVQLIGACSDPPMLIMAYAPKGTLKDVLDAQDISLDARLDLVRGISDGMFALHDKDILHLDLKPPNVLINAANVPWITDFGLAFAMSSSMSAGSTISGRGTMNYKAPESFRPKRNGGAITHKPTDVYSFALLAWETFTGRVPFANKTDTELSMMHMEVYVYGEEPERPSLENVPVKVQAIVVACWEHAFEQRPTFERVCERLGRLGRLEAHGEGERKASVGSDMAEQLDRIVVNQNRIEMKIDSLSVLQNQLVENSDRTLDMLDEIWEQTAFGEVMPPEVQYSLCGELAQIERKRITNALKLASGNQTKAAQSLNIGRTALIAKMKKYNLV